MDHENDANTHIPIFRPLFWPVRCKSAQGNFSPENFQCSGYEVQTPVNYSTVQIHVMEIVPVNIHMSFDMWNLCMEGLYLNY
jgi:hypothetical protein